MIKIYANILGIDANLIADQTNASRSKIISLAQLLLIPIFIWFLSGYLMASKLLELSQPIALLTGVICGSIIYIVDRSFITAHGRSSQTTMIILRIAFALLSGVLGAIALDTVIFEGDINKYQFDKAQTEFIAENDSIVRAKTIALDSSRVRYNREQLDFNKELDGKGSGMIGYGNIAKKKEEAVKSARAEYQEAKAKLAFYTDSVSERSKEFADNKVTSGSQTILNKVHDLHEFVLLDGINLGFYLLFFSLTLLLETMLIAYKAGSAKTAFDAALLAEEDSRLQRIKAIQRNKDKYNLAIEKLGIDNVLEMERASRKYGKAI